MKSIVDLQTDKLSKCGATIETLEATIDEGLGRLADLGTTNEHIATVSVEGATHGELVALALKYRSGGWRVAFNRLGGTRHQFHVWHPDVLTEGFGTGAPWEGTPSAYARERMDRQQEECRKNRETLGLEL